MKVLTRLRWMRCLGCLLVGMAVPGAGGRLLAEPPSWESEFGSELVALRGKDDGATAVTLGFPFPFGGRQFTTIHVGVNGVIGLGEPGAAAGYPITDQFQTTTAPVIAPFWTDLDVRRQGAVWVREAGGRVVVTWSGVGSSAHPEGGFTFQARLGADGTIEFGYHAIEPLERYSVDSVVHVGFSAGALSRAPVPVDFADDVPLVTGETVLQRVWTPERFRLEGTNLRFVPRAGGGYDAVLAGDVVARPKPAVWEDEPGVPLAGLAGQDDGSVAVDLGFAFPFGEQVFNTVHVGANGAVALGAPGSVETVPSNAVFAGTEAPILAPFWTDLDLSLMGEVRVLKTAGRAVITWIRAGTYQDPGVPFTFQLHLHADGRVVFAWRGISPLKPETIDNAVFVGITAGRRTSPPPAVAFEAQAVFVHAQTVHHRFSVGDSFPLDGESVEFEPRGSAQYRIAFSGRAGEQPPRPPVWELEHGDEVAALAGADDEAVAIDLGFGFPFGGGTHSRVWVGSNGVLGLGGEGEAGGYGSETGFRQTSSPILAPFWTDLTLEAIGTIRVRTEVSRAVFTWAGVATYADEGVPVMFQVTLHGDGRIVFGYSGIPSFTDARLGGDVWVGMSPGGLPALPAEVRYVADAPFGSGTAVLQRYTAVRPFDLDGHNVVFTPTGSASYSVTVLKPSTEESRFHGIQVVAGGVELRWNSRAGVSYRVLSKATWADPWTPLGSVLATGTEAVFVDGRSPGATQFYRIEW